MRYRQALFCIFIVSGLSACGDRSNSVTAERTDPVKTGSSVSPVATLKEVVANDNCGINSPLPGTDVDKSKILPVWGYAINRTNWTIPESVSIRVSSMSGDHHVVVPAKRGGCTRKAGIGKFWFRRRGRSVVASGRRLHGIGASDNRWQNICMQ
jgi:hypothetical protein